MEIKKLQFNEGRIKGEFDAWVGFTYDNEALYRIFEDNNKDLHLSFIKGTKYEVLQSRLHDVVEGKRIAQQHFEEMCEKIIKRISL